MKKLMACMLCAIPLGFASTGYAQGRGGPTGSGAASAEQQAESTSPSALSGTSAQREPGHKKITGPSSGKTPAEPASSTNPHTEGGAGHNRSSSGDSTKRSANQTPESNTAPTTTQPDRR